MVRCARGVGSCWSVKASESRYCATTATRMKRVSAVKLWKGCCVKTTIRKVQTVQLNEKLFILNGHDPIKYLDLTTNKVHQYEAPRKSLRERLFKKKFKPEIDLKTDGYIKPRPAMIWKETDGFKTIGNQPNVMNVLTPQMKNICCWYDGTAKPSRGHNGLCTWRFDGQFYIHNRIDKQ